MRLLTTLAIGSIAFCCSAGSMFATQANGPTNDKVDKCGYCVRFKHQGPTGPTGSTGATGATGLTGAVGPKGDIGLQGLAGEKGPAGAKGDNGQPGAPGDIGLTGPIVSADYIEAVLTPSTYGMTNPLNPYAFVPHDFPATVNVLPLNSSATFNGSLVLSTNTILYDVPHFSPFSAPYSIVNNGSPGVFSLNFYVNGVVNLSVPTTVRLETLPNGGSSWSKVEDFIFSPVEIANSFYPFSYLGTRDWLIQLNTGDQIRLSLPQNSIILMLGGDHDTVRISLRRMTPS